MRKLANSMLMPVAGAVRRAASTRLAIAALAAAVTAAVVGGVAAAAIPDNGGVIHGCYNQVNGGLRIVNSGVACKPGEVALPWNQQGPQGPPGRPGPTGVAVTASIPPTDPNNPPFVPVTLHLTTGTWHVTGEGTGGSSDLSSGDCFFPATTGTILGDVNRGGADAGSVSFLVKVDAAEATVTMSCREDTETGSTFSYTLFAVPVVMQQ